MITPKKIIIKDLELANAEIRRLRKENKELKKENERLTENLTNVWMLYKNVMRIK